MFLILWPLLRRNAKTTLRSFSVFLYSSLIAEGGISSPRISLKVGENLGVAAIRTLPHQGSPRTPVLYFQKQGNHSLNLSALPANRDCMSTKNQLCDVCLQFRPPVHGRFFRGVGLIIGSHFF
jgi:hypothetical protein